MIYILNDLYIKSIKYQLNKYLLCIPKPLKSIKLHLKNLIKTLNQIITHISP